MRINLLNFKEMEVLYNRDSDFVAEGYTDVETDNYTDFTESWIKELPRIMKEDAGVWIFSGWTNLVDILNSLRINKLTLINHIIWKYQFGVFTKRKFVTSHYHLLFAVKDEKNYFFNKIEHYPLDVWEINREYERGTKKNATAMTIVPQLRSRCPLARSNSLPASQEPTRKAAARAGKIKLMSFRVELV